MTDIVERLRNDDVVWGVRPSLALEAADEIERLREGLRKIRGGLGDPISNLLPHEIAQAALQQKESE